MDNVPINAVALYKTIELLFGANMIPVVTQAYQTLDRLMQNAHMQGFREGYDMGESAGFKRGYADGDAAGYAAASDADAAATRDAFETQLEMDSKSVRLDTEDFDY